MNMHTNALSAIIFLMEYASLQGKYIKEVKSEQWEQSISQPWLKTMAEKKTSANHQPKVLIQHLQRRK